MSQDRSSAPAPEPVPAAHSLDPRRHDGRSVWVRHKIWHAQATSKYILLVKGINKRISVPILGVTPEAVKANMERWQGKYEFRHVLGRPDAYNIAFTLADDYKVRVEVAEMLWNDWTLMDLLFRPGAYTRALTEAKAGLELAILDRLSDRMFMNPSESEE